MSDNTRLVTGFGESLGSAADRSGLANAVVDTARLRLSQMLTGAAKIAREYPMSDKAASHFLLTGEIDQVVETTAGRFVVAVRRA